MTRRNDFLEYRTVCRKTTYKYLKSSYQYFLGVCHNPLIKGFTLVTKAFYKGKKLNLGVLTHSLFLYLWLKSYPKTHLITRNW